MIHHSLFNPFLANGAASSFSGITALSSHFASTHVVARDLEKANQTTNTNDGFLYTGITQRAWLPNEIRGDWKQLYNGAEAPGPEWENHVYGPLSGGESSVEVISAFTPGCSMTHLWKGEMIEVYGTLEGVAAEELNSTDIMDIFLDGKSIRDQTPLHLGNDDRRLFSAAANHGHHNLTVVTGSSFKGNLTFIGTHLYYTAIVEPEREIVPLIPWTTEVMMSNMLPFAMDGERIGTGNLNTTGSIDLKWSSQDEPLTASFDIQRELQTGRYTIQYTATASVHAELLDKQGSFTWETAVLHGTSQLKMALPMNTTVWMLGVMMGPDFGTVYAEFTPQPPNTLPISNDCNRTWYASPIIMPTVLDPAVEYVVTLSSREETAGLGVHLHSTIVNPYFLNGTDWWWPERRVDGVYYPDPNFTYETYDDLPSTESETIESSTSQPVTSETSTSKIATEEPTSDDSPTNDGYTDTSTVPLGAAMCLSKVK